MSAWAQWDLRGEEPEREPGQGGGGGGFGGNQAPQAEPGAYRIMLSVNGEELSTTITVLEDIWLGQR